MQEYIEPLLPGDVVDARITHLEPFGAFADIGCGIITLLPIDGISISRIEHPRERFFPIWISAPLSKTGKTEKSPCPTRNFSVLGWKMPHCFPPVKPLLGLSVP